MGRVRPGVAVAGLSVLTLALLVHDAVRKPAPPGPHVQASIALDKRVYAQGETVSARVTVTNDGPVAAERVLLDCADAAGNCFSTNYLAAGEDWLRLTARSSGEMTLAPSESFTTRMSGVVSSSAANVGTMGILCGVTYDGSGKRLVQSQTEAAVAGTSNAVTGRFTICHDDHLGAAGVRLTLERSYNGTDEPPPGPWSAVTDADGRFTFPVVAAGRYVLRYEPAPGYAPTPLPGAIDLLVAADDLRWQGPLTVTTTDPATRCEY